MAKPPIATVRFAVDGSDVDSPLIGTGPDAGLRDAGYALDAVPTSADFDFLLNKYYRWFQYINAGAFEGASSFNDALVVAGALTVGGNTIVGGQALVVASTTFTADNTTDILTATAHGLQTGDGPLHVSNSGGALPSGLVAGTDYWSVRLGANTFALSATREDALVGFVIDFASNGTGTQSIVSTGGTTRVSDVTVSRNLPVSGAISASSVVIGGSAFSFASSVFTANATFDTMDVPGHGLQTGYGPMRVSNSGGALPVPLAAATDYWVIRSNANKFSLATSFPDAMAGLAIDLTTNGTGTNSIVSASNANRSGSVTIHGDLLVDGRLVPLVTTPWPMTAHSFVLTSGAGTVDFNSWSFTANGDVVASLWLPAGTLLSRIRVGLDRGGGTNGFSFFIGSGVLLGGASDAGCGQDFASSGPATIDLILFGSNSLGNFDGTAGSHVTRMDKVYQLRASATRNSGTLKLYGAIINPNP